MNGLEKEYLWMPPEAREAFLDKLKEYLADPERARTDFLMDYFEADLVYKTLQRDLTALTWFAEVKCAGGWKIIGAFSDEASAWQFGEKHIDVRMWKMDELIAVRSNSGPWQKPTEEGAGDEFR